jgi:ABC-type multidrug transport system ATPase subunit
MTDYVIDVHDLSKSFGARRVVKDLRLQVTQGEVCGFLGANGSGKTTTIRMLCGLLKPDSGSGTCLGLDIVRDAAAIRRQIGYMTQRFSYYEDLTVRENLELVAGIYEMPNARDAVREIIVRMQLTEYAEQLAAHLSGGWQQRLALAACMLHRPKLLLLDEPTAGVERGASSGTASTTWRSRGSPCSYRPTTWTKPSAVIGSSISPAGVSWSRATPSTWRAVRA